MRENLGRGDLLSTFSTIKRLSEIAFEEMDEAVKRVHKAVKKRRRRNS